MDPESDQVVEESIKGSDGSRAKFEVARLVTVAPGDDVEQCTMPIRGNMALYVGAKAPVRRTKPSASAPAGRLYTMMISGDPLRALASPSRARDKPYCIGLATLIVYAIGATIAYTNRPGVRQMNFVTVRELRGKSAAVWDALASKGDLVVTSNGKPIAILSSTTAETLETSLTALRQARAQLAVAEMQARARESGADRMTLEEINAEIAKVRSQRPA